MSKINSVEHCCFSKGKVLHISLTPSCNQHCIHCMRSAAPEKFIMLGLPEFCTNLEKAIYRLSPKRIIISGGEPTLLPNLNQIVKLIKAFGYNSSLCTNATLIDHVFALELKKSGVNKATVGIEGIGGAYDRFRRSGQGFVRMEKGLSSLIHAGIQTTVNVTLSNSGLNQRNEIACFLEKYKLSSVSVTSPIFQGRAKLHPEQFDGLTWQKVIAFAEYLSDFMPFPVDLRIPQCDSIECPSEKQIFSLSPTGSLSGCFDKHSTNVINFPQIGKVIGYGN